ncbi:MAG: fatty acid desaturase family protein [Pseudomonadota bacterium]
MAVSDWLSEAEIKAVTQRSDWRAAWLVASNWLLIGAVFWVCYVWANPLVWLLGCVVLGARQLGLAILMHEAGHTTLFRTASANRVVGQWLCAYPILSDMQAYATSHRQHHQLAGTRDDPDLANYASYPVTSDSFRRKIVRDLSGQTGLRNLMGLFKNDGGDIMLRGSDQRPPVTQGLIVNLVLLGLLWLLATPWLYLLWLAAYVFFYPLSARIRQLAEHACVPDLYDPDPRNNTRTTTANLLERLLICPNHVNYHCEHHFMPNVPGYRLRALHQLLMQKGFYDTFDEALAAGYRSVLRRAITT